jgi:hypothetical protein
MAVSVWPILPNAIGMFECSKEAVLNVYAASGKLAVVLTGRPPQSAKDGLNRKRSFTRDEYLCWKS